MSEIGLLAQGSKINAENLLIANCGTNLVNLNIGGDYIFRHCTFANFWPFSVRQTPSIFLNNYYTDNTGQIQNRDLIQAYFGNCIFDGVNENEIFFDKSDDALFNFTMNTCLLKLDSTYWTSWKNELCENNILNNGNNFVDYEVFDFELDSTSQAINTGSTIIAEEVPFDINGVNRTTNPDLGCFEKIE